MRDSKRRHLWESKDTVIHASQTGHVRVFVDRSYSKQTTNEKALVVTVDVDEIVHSTTTEHSQIDLSLYIATLHCLVY
jgi:hypothetical protein